MIPVQRSSGQFKYLATADASGSFDVSANQERQAVVNTGGVCLLGTGSNASHRIVPLTGYRGARIQFFGEGADNATFNFRIFTATFGFSPNGINPGQHWSEADDVALDTLIADTSTATLSTSVGVTGDGGLVLSTQRMADTLSWTLATDATTPRGSATIQSAAYGLGTIDEYSPANQVPAWLFIPDFGNVDGFLIDFDLTGATAANALIQLTK